MTTIAEAIAEAYAHAPQDVIVLDAVEIDHPSFIQPIRVVRWPVTGPEPERFWLRHEADAGLNPGEVVEYLGLPFEVIPPESSSNSEGRFDFRVGVTDDVDRYLREAVLNQARIVATFREYVKGREAEGPGLVFPDLEVDSPRREGGHLTFTGVLFGWMSRPYGDIYRPGDYPALVTGY